MSTQILKNAGFWLGKYDLTGYANSGELSLTTDALDDTRFSTSGATGDRSYVPGLRDWNASVSGFLDADMSAVDAKLYDKWADNDSEFTIATEGKSVGDVCYFGYAAQTSYEHSASIGDLLGYTVNLNSAKSGSNGRIYRGNLLKYGTVTTDPYTGTAYNAGAVGSSDLLVAVLHVSAFTATSIDFILQSDDASGFSDPTDQMTFTSVTGTTSEIISQTGDGAGGEITDTYWRIKADSTALTTVTFSVAMAII